MGLFGRKRAICTICNKEIIHKHKAKKEWYVKSPLCADCYLDKIYLRFNVIKSIFRTTIPKSFFINLNNSLTQKYNQYVWMLMVRYQQVVQSRKMLLAFGLYKQYLYYVAPIARLQGRL